jgi:hypothetical protein
MTRKAEKRTRYSELFYCVITVTRLHRRNSFFWTWSERQRHAAIGNEDTVLRFLRDNPRTGAQTVERVIEDAERLLDAEQGRAVEHWPVLLTLLVFRKLTAIQQHVIEALYHLAAAYGPCVIAATTAIASWIERHHQVTLDPTQVGRAYLVLDALGILRIVERGVPGLGSKKATRLELLFPEPDVPRKLSLAQMAALVPGAVIQGRGTSAISWQPGTYRLRADGSAERNMSGSEKPMLERTYNSFTGTTRARQPTVDQASGTPGVSSSRPLLVVGSSIESNKAEWLLIFRNCAVAIKWKMRSWQVKQPDWLSWITSTRTCAGRGPLLRTGIAAACRALGLSPPGLPGVLGIRSSPAVPPLRSVSLSRTPFWSTPERSTAPL